MRSLYYNKYLVNYLPNAECPKCLHITFALIVVQIPQILPHWLLKQISTVPDKWFGPPDNRTAPLLQTAIKK